MCPLLVWRNNRIYYKINAKMFMMKTTCGKTKFNYNQIYVCIKQTLKQKRFVVQMT